MSSKYREMKKENITDKSYQLTTTSMMPKNLIFPQNIKKNEKTKNRLTPFILIVLKIVFLLKLQRVCMY
jgi:hypothetical protein